MLTNLGQLVKELGNCNRVLLNLGWFLILYHPLQ
jgi:hypothetical protein